MMRIYTEWVKQALLESGIATPEQAESFYEIMRRIGEESDDRELSQTPQED